MGKKSRATAQRVEARAAKNAPKPLDLPHRPVLASVAVSNAAATSLIDSEPLIDGQESEAATDRELNEAAANRQVPSADQLNSQTTPAEPLEELQELMADALAQPPATPSPDDEPFELLRTLLFGEQRQQIADMRQQIEKLQRLLDDLEVQINDEEALVSTITPVIASAIRTNITESRDEMIDALYPIMGKLVQRSVTEAMRDLARRIDEQMRRTFNFKALWRQMFARMHGVSDAEMALRNAFPFQVLQIFLIHRETGLLLMHCGQQAEDSRDSDLISSMLTAIRDFTEDAFGRGQEAELNEIQYGDRSILIEVAHLVYLAVVCEGVLRSGFREQMRETMITIEHQHTAALRTYDGDASRFVSADELLRTLLVKS